MIDLATHRLDVDLKLGRWKLVLIRQPDFHVIEAIGDVQHPPGALVAYLDLHGVVLFDGFSHWFSERGFDAFCDYYKMQDLPIPARDDALALFAGAICQIVTGRRR